MLSNNPLGYTMAEIRARIKATRRTIYRDIESLASAGIYLERETMPSREVRYKLPQEYRFVKTSFDENELFSLFFAKNLLKPLEGTPFGKGINSALDKIYKLLPANMQNYCFFAESYFVFKQPFKRSYKEFEANIRRLKEAILTDRKCQIEYVKDNSKPTTHVIHPYFVTYVDGLLYVIAYSEQREMRRNFRVDRITKLKILSRKFERPDAYQSENFEAERQLGKSFTIHSDDNVQHVAIRFSKKCSGLIRDRTWHASQKLRNGANGQVILSMDVPINPEVVSWILSFGEDAEVLRPKELIERVSSHLRQASNHYAL
jgi:proteasome accessory factor B